MVQRKMNRGGKITNNKRGDYIQNFFSGFFFDDWGIPPCTS